MHSTQALYLDGFCYFQGHLTPFAILCVPEFFVRSVSSSSLLKVLTETFLIFYFFVSVSFWFVHFCVFAASNCGVCPLRLESFIYLCEGFFLPDWCCLVSVERTMRTYTYVLLDGAACESNDIPEHKNAVVPYIKN